MNEEDKIFRVGTAKWERLETEETIVSITDGGDYGQCKTSVW